MLPSAGMASIQYQALPAPPPPLLPALPAVFGSAGSALADPVTVTSVLWAGPMLLLSTLQGQVGSRDLLCVVFL